MKRCPTCNKTFTDRNLSFCIDDGTPLVPVESAADEVTRVSPSPGGGSSGAPDNQGVPPYLPPRTYAPPGTPNQPRRRAGPWLWGILALLLLLLAGIGIAAAIFLPKLIREVTNSNDSNGNANVNRNDRNSNSNRRGSNSNSNAIGETNDNSGLDENKPAPTDEQQVLSELTDLEHEWTAANINADKKKLDRILADDYAGKDANGNIEGKADYLRTVQRDTTIQKWDFEDLKVDLNGSRAALSGIIRLQVNNKPQAFRFTDKFVWREGRWQAVGSEVTPLEE